MSKYCSQQFKDEAVALALESDCPYSQIAKDLGGKLSDLWKLDEKSHVKQAIKAEQATSQQIKITKSLNESSKTPARSLLFVKRRLPS